MGATRRRHDIDSRRCMDRLEGNPALVSTSRSRGSASGFKGDPDRDPSPSAALLRGRSTARAALCVAKTIALSGDGRRGPAPCDGHRWGSGFNPGRCRRARSVSSGQAARPGASCAEADDRGPHRHLERTWPVSTPSPLSSYPAGCCIGAALGKISLQSLRAYRAASASKNRAIVVGESGWVSSMLPNRKTSYPRNRSARSSATMRGALRRAVVAQVVRRRVLSVGAAAPENFWTCSSPPLNDTRKSPYTLDFWCCSGVA
jgi:hypothetical protein